MTGTKAMAHSLKHAPTREEGERVVRLAFQSRRAERFIETRRIK